MKVIRFAAGLAVGYVLGSRAGREQYEQIVAAARKAQAHPAVTQVQQKAKALLGTEADPLQTSTYPASSEAQESVPPASSLPRPARRQPRDRVMTPTPDPLA